MFQSLQQGWQGQQLETGCGQFNRQGQAIETPTDLDDEQGILETRLKRGLDLPRSFKEERHRAITCELFGIRQMLWIGQGQWEDSKGVFAAHMQDLPTGHEHCKLRASSQQVSLRGCRHAAEDSTRPASTQSW